MRYSMSSTLNEILSRPGMRDYLPYFFSEEALACFPKDLADAPLSLIRYRGKTPWSKDLCEASEQLVDAANLISQIQKGKRRCVDPGTGRDWFPEGVRKEAEPAEVFLVTPKIRKKITKTRPALLICPGGGYEFVSFANEGTPIAERVQRRGYLPFLLRYSTAPARFPKPQVDLVEAICYIRRHAAEYGVDPERIGLVGFSAGGHLVASTMCLYAHLAMGISEDAALHPPRAIALGYPVITFETGSTHEGSFQALTGGQEYLRSRLSVENMLPEGGAFPAAYVFACEDDETVPPENARILKRALDDRGIPCSLRLFPQGGHGCGLGFATSAFSWSGEMLDFFDRQLAAKGRDTIPTRESK